MDKPFTKLHEAILIGDQRMGVSEALADLWERKLTDELDM